MPFLPLFGQQPTGVLEILLPAPAAEWIRGTAWPAISGTAWTLVFGVNWAVIIGTAWATITGRGRRDVRRP